MPNLLGTTAQLVSASYRDRLEYLATDLSSSLYVLLHLFPLGTLWMNWALCGSCIFCLPVLLLFKEQYNRLNVDLNAKEELSLTDTDTRKTPLTSDNVTDESDISDSGILLTEKTKMLSDIQRDSSVAEPTGMTLEIPNVQYGVNT